MICTVTRASAINRALVLCPCEVTVARAPEPLGFGPFELNPFTERFLCGYVTQTYTHTVSPHMYVAAN